MWPNAWAVVRREYLQRVRSKAFIFSTVALPLFMAAVFVVPMYFASRDQEGERRIAVVDSTGVLYGRIAPGLEESGWSVRAESSPEAVSLLRQRVDEGEIGGFIVLGARTLETGEAVFYADERPSALDRLVLRTAISRAAMEQGLEQSGVDADAMLRGGDLRVELLSQAGLGTEDPNFLVAYIGAFILYMLFIIGHLAWESKAGKFGTFVLFLGLSFGMVGFIAKYVIQWIIEK